MVTTTSIDERIANAKRLMNQWFNDMTKDAETLIKAHTWLVAHPHHAQRTEQINKYFELKSKYTETEFWYYTCFELYEIGHSVIHPSNEDKIYNISSDKEYLESNSGCLLPQEFALARSVRLSR